MNSPEYRKLMCLMWDLVDNRLDTASAAELEDLLQDDPSARKIYAEFLGLTSALRSTYSLGAGESAFPGIMAECDLPIAGGSSADRSEGVEAGRPRPDRPSPRDVRGHKLPLTRGSNRRSAVQNLSLATSILAVAAVFYGVFALLSVGLRPERVWHDAPEIAVATAPTVAFLTDGEHAVWTDRSTVTGVRAALTSGKKLELAGGWAAITFGNGARVDLQGPATLIVDDRNKATLVDGKLTAKVPREAIGFAVQTPTMLVVDLGTIFGVEVSPEHNDQVHVFKGQVELKFCPLGSAVESRDSVRLRAGQAMCVDPVEMTVTPIVSDSKRFRAQTEQTPNQTAQIDLPIGEAYVAAVKTSRPIAYWRFEEILENHYIRNEMGSDWPALPKGSVQIGGPWGYRRAIFTADDAAQYIEVEGTLKGVRDACTIELFARPDEHHEGELVSLVQPSFTNEAGSSFVSLGALELLPPEHNLFAGRTLRFLHRNPPGAFDGVNVISRHPYQPKAWHHVVATRSASRMSLYINGALVGSEATRQEPVVIDPHIVIGRLYREGEANPVQLEHRQLRGQIDELSIYDRELTAEEVQRHYAASGLKDVGSEQ